jgi:uncharacterized protein (TIGR02246 family)
MTFVFMSDIEEKTKIKQLISDYAAALNSANIELIPSFYAEDGLFMPDGLRTFTTDDLSNKLRGTYLKRSQFSISYDISDVVVNGDFAFIQAQASTLSVNPTTGKTTTKSSRDLFVLTQEENNWKIYRYIFNNVKEHLQ